MTTPFVPTKQQLLGFEEDTPLGRTRVVRMHGARGYGCEHCLYDAIDTESLRGCFGNGCVLGDVEGRMETVVVLVKNIPRLAMKGLL